MGSRERIKGTYALCISKTLYHVYLDVDTSFTCVGHKLLKERTNNISMPIAGIGCQLDWRNTTKTGPLRAERSILPYVLQSRRSPEPKPCTLALIKEDMMSTPSNLANLLCFDCSSILGVALSLTSLLDWIPLSAQVYPTDPISNVFYSTNYVAIAKRERENGECLRRDSVQQNRWYIPSSFFW